MNEGTKSGICASILFADNTNASHFIVFVTFLLTLVVIRKYFAGRNYTLDKIPGPRGIPIFGNFLQLGESPHTTLTKLRHIYSDVFRIYIGNTPVIIVNGMVAIKEALVKRSSHFADRPSLQSFNEISGGFSMAFGRYSERWKVHRRIATTALRMYTSGHQLDILQEIIKNEIFELMNVLTDNNNEEGNVLDPQSAIRIAFANIISVIEFGKRYAHDDEELQRVVLLADRFADNASGFTNPADYMSWMKYLPNPKGNELRAIQKELDLWIRKRIADHRQTFGGVQRDVMDNLLKVSQEMDSNEMRRVGLTEKHILATAQDLFGAGFDTTATCMHWALLYLVKYPTVQYKVQNEMDRVVGRTRLPTFNDRSQLVYTDSFILEVLRHASVVPFTLPHATTCTSILDDYVIPKDTVLFFNLWSVNHDPKLWSEPHEFCPERFINSDGQTLNKEAVSKLVSFSVGRRKCPGETLAKLEVFLALAILLHQCQFDKSNERLPGLEGRYGITLRPQLYKIHVQRR
ncbi:cytochrome P450 1A1-like [Glandiceps talaboti]